MAFRLFKNILGKITGSGQAPIERYIADCCREHIDSQRGVDGKWKKKVMLFSIERTGRGQYVKTPSPFNHLPLLKKTKALYKSINARLVRAGHERVNIVVSGEFYGVYQDKGFTTTGPNYIPLTNRKINKQSGRDYFIAKNGVTVPSRAWIDLTPSDIVGLTGLVAKAAANSIVKDVVQNKSLKGEMKWQN